MKIPILRGFHKEGENPQKNYSSRNLDMVSQRIADSLKKLKQKLRDRKNKGQKSV
jgi:hypothetical protein